jgi:hypothetical protein
MEKRLPPGQIHHTWTLWRSQHESATSEVRSLLSSVDAAVADRFVDRVLGELIRASGGQELLETLRAFIAAGARERIAAELGIHRHTVRARMAKIEKLLGRDLSRAEEVQAVALALELAELQPNRSRPHRPHPEVFGPERLRDLEDSARASGFSDADAHAGAEVAHGHGLFDAGVFERRRQISAQRQPHDSSPVLRAPPSPVRAEQRRRRRGPVAICRPYRAPGPNG